MSDMTKALTAQSKDIKDHEVLRCGNNTTEVTAPTSSGASFRYAVSLELKTCSCRLWQVSGKPCKHALAFIAKLSREVQMDDFVHDYFSVEKLRNTYSGVFNLMTSKHFWPRVDLGYKIKKPKLRRKPGRPRKIRIKVSDEHGARKRKRYSECHELGHTSKKCQRGLTAKEKKMFASHENASEVESNDPPTSSTRGRGTSSQSSTTGSSNDDASNIGGGSRTGRGRCTSSSHTETTNDGATHVRGGRPPSGRGWVEAEAEAEVEEEVLQGMLLCSMCRNDHCSGYVITSERFVVYV